MAWLFKTVPVLIIDLLISRNLHYYKSYDIIQCNMYIFRFVLSVVFLFFVSKVITSMFIRLYRRLNCLRSAKTIAALPPFIRILGIFLFNAQLGTSTSYPCAMSIF